MNMVISDSEIEARYEKERHQFCFSHSHVKLLSCSQKLQQITHFYSEESPAWDKQQQSCLIDSLLINLPIRPILVFQFIEGEYDDYRCYEVIDGKQRVKTLIEFFTNQLVLEGMEWYPELNGRKYSDLPYKVKSGLNTCYMFITKVFANPPFDSPEAFFLKKNLFQLWNNSESLEPID